MVLLGCALQFHVEPSHGFVDTLNISEVLR